MRITVGGASKYHSVGFRPSKPFARHSEEHLFTTDSASSSEYIFRERPQSYGTENGTRFPTLNTKFEAQSGRVDAETEAAYRVLVVVLDEANFAVQRIAVAYGASLAHLQECRFESSAAHEILARSNKAAELAATAPAHEP